MPAAPPTADESRRIAALLRCGVLDTPPEADFDDITRLAASVCQTPIALVSLVDSARQWFKSRVGLDAQETPREQAFCAHAILGRTPLIIEDAATHPLTADNPLVTGLPHIRFYAGVPLRLPSGEALGTLCVIDLEPRHLDERQVRDLVALAGQAASQLRLRENIHRLEAAEKAANAASRAKSDFIANISHEIRTPLHAILGYAEIIENHLAAAPPPQTPSEQAAQAAQAATAVAANAQHLVAIVNDLLDFSKFEAGRFEISPVPTRPNRLIEEAIAIVRPQADKKGVALLAKPGPTLPASLSTDPVRLRQILVNLLANAVKFTEQGSVTLEAAYDRPASRLAVRVVDTGIGMSPEQLERIARFEPFSQADASTTRRFGGTGLGLAISHRFATLLGGGIQIHSAQGQGSAFTLTINAAPAEDAHSSSTHPALPVCPGPHGDNAPSKPLAARSILVAEDGPDNQRLARYFLERAGASVTIAANGIEALSAHQAHLTHHARQTRHAPAPPGYDLILMDLQMPEMDGYESTRRLRLAGCTSPIIALTANTAHAERQACLDAGCDQFISKPIRGPELVQACVIAIANGHQRRGDTAMQAA